MHHILLAEKLKEVQDLIGKILGPQKVRISNVQNAQDVKNLLKKSAENFDLILLDVNLPDQDGFQLCLEIRSDEKLKKIPIIFISETNSSTDKIVAMAMGAEDFIVRPFNPMDFWAKVQMGLKNKA